MDGNPIEPASTFSAPPALHLSAHSARPPHATPANRTLALTQVPVGERVRLLKLEAAVGLMQRLAGMGFLQGVELEVVKRHSGKNGPMVVRLGDCRLALGWQLANEIQVEISGRLA